MESVLYFGTLALARLDMALLFSRLRGWEALCGESQRFNCLLGKWFQMGGGEIVWNFDANASIEGKPLSNERLPLGMAIHLPG